MKDIKKKVLCFGAAVALVVSSAAIFTGCNGKNEEEIVELTYWMPLPSSISTKVTNMGDTPFYQEVQKQTGIKIKFIHPPAGSENEQLNTMIASGDLPDIIERDWSSYSGAEAKAAEDGILIELTDYIDKYAPDFKNIVENEVPLSKRWVTTNGRYYVFPSLSTATDYITQNGLLIRKDLLDKFGLEIPETFDEFENVLRTFKKNGVKYPFMNKWSNAFGHYCSPISAFDIVGNQIFVDNGEVKHGYLQPELKEYLSRMSSLIKEGLIDPEIMTMDWNSNDNKIASGEVGSTVNSITAIKKLTDIAKKANPDAQYVACPFLSMSKDKPTDTIYYNRIDGYTFANAVGITTKCKNVEAAVKFLNYAYTEKGHMLYNFGVEGQTYNIVDGKPEFTELITNNPDGLTFDEAVNMYTRAEAAGYVEQNYFDLIYHTAEQQDAAKLWSEQCKAAIERNGGLPKVFWRACAKLTGEETDKISNIQLGFTSYANEMTSKFFLGSEPIENFDSFVNELKTKKIEDLIPIYQKAVDRLK